MIQSSPEVSIIMPAYNVGSYIATAIDSVLRQSFQDWELIIINDASTDNTEAVIKTYDDARIRYICSAKLGKPSKVRNVGLKLARGKYITFLDSDDAYYPDAIEQLLSCLKRQPELNAVIAFPYHCDRNLDLLHLPPELVETAEGELTFAPDFSLNWESICAQKLTFFLSSLIMKREIAEKLGMLDEDLTTSEDFKYHVELLEYGLDKIKILPICTYLYRNHFSSVTKNAERIYDSVNDHELVVDWLFSRSFVTKELYSLKGHNLVNRWSAATMLLTLSNRPDLAWKITWRAFSHREIGFSLWCKYFYKHIIRLCIPHDLLMFCMTRLLKRQTYLYYSGAQA